MSQFDVLCSNRLQLSELACSCRTPCCRRLPVTGGLHLSPTCGRVLCPVVSPPGAPTCHSRSISPCSTQTGKYEQWSTQGSPIQQRQPGGGSSRMCHDSHRKASSSSGLYFRQEGWDSLGVSEIADSHRPLLCWADLPRLTPGTPRLGFGVGTGGKGEGGEKMRFCFSRGIVRRGKGGREEMLVLPMRSHIVSPPWPSHLHGWLGREAARPGREVAVMTT